ncbi:MAG TPA: peptidylprolyl isomerase [Pirellulales bacterium]
MLRCHDQTTGQLRLSAWASLAVLVWMAVASSFETASAQNLMNGGSPFPLQGMPAPLRPNSYVIQGPSSVSTPTRPSGWPGAPPAAGITSGSPITQGGTASGKTSNIDKSMQFDLVDLDGARQIARVGPEVIQDYEVSTYVNEVLEHNASKIPPNQLETVRNKLTRDRLNNLIEVKLALVDAQRKVPPEALPKIMQSLEQDFEGKEVKKKIAALKLKSRAELEAKMRERGSSLDRERQAFVEQQLAFGWIAQQTKTKHEATHEDMLAYYLQHLEDYSFNAKARWEEIRLRVANFPSREAARRALGDLGNAIIHGANFAELARTKSQGPTAADGGQYDWTTQGSLASDLTDEALFSLPIGRMSQILDDGRSATVSIVRVLERKEAGREPFTEVQSEIKDKLAVAHSVKDKIKLHEYMEKLRADTPVWTIYDEQLAPDAEANAQNRPQQNDGGPVSSTTMRPATPNDGKTKPANPYLR